MINKPKFDKNDFGGNIITGKRFYWLSFSGMDLSRFTFKDCTFDNCDFISTNLRDSRLTGSRFLSCNFNNASFVGSCWEYIYFELCYFENSNLNLFSWYNVRLYTPFSLPDHFKDHVNFLPEGDFIAYKALKDGKIAELLIPKEAEKSNGFGRKCRASYARVRRIYKPGEKNKELYRGRSLYDDTFLYITGKVVEPLDRFDSAWYTECAPGIHFFLTEEEAILLAQI